MSDPRLPSQDSASPRHIRVHPLVTLFVWAAVLILALHFFPAFKTILLGLLAAGALAAAFRPLQQRIPGSRWIGATLAGVVPILVLGGTVTLLAWYLAGPVREQLANWSDVRQNINQSFSSWSSRFGLGGTVTVESLFQQLQGFITGPRAADAVSKAADIVSGALLALLLVIFGTIYILASKRSNLIEPLARALPADRHRQLYGALDDLEPRLRWWLIGMLIAMVVTGVATWIGLVLIGMPMALPLALLAVLAEIVPNVGPAFAFLVILLVAATQGTTALVGVLILYLIVQLLESYILQPLVMRKAVDMPPIVTLFSIIFWSMIFGAPGLLLALPLNLLVWSLLDHFVLRPRRDRVASPAPAPPPS